MGEFIEFNRENFGRKGDIEFSKKLSEQSITIVKNEHELLPLHPNKQTVLLWPSFTYKSHVDEALKQSYTLGHFLQGILNLFIELSLSTDEPVLNACKETGQIIIATYALAQSEVILQM